MSILLDALKKAALDKRKVSSQDRSLSLEGDLDKEINAHENSVIDGQLARDLSFNQTEDSLEQDSLEEGHEEPYVEMDLHIDEVFFQSQLSSEKNALTIDVETSPRLTEEANIEIAQNVADDIVDESLGSLHIKTLSAAHGIDQNTHTDYSALSHENSISDEKFVLSGDSVEDNPSTEQQHRQNSVDIHLNALSDDISTIALAVSPDRDQLIESLEPNHSVSDDQSVTASSDQNDETTLASPKITTTEVTTKGLAEEHKDARQVEIDELLSKQKKSSRRRHLNSLIAASVVCGIICCALGLYYWDIQKNYSRDILVRHIPQPIHTQAEQKIAALGTDPEVLIVEGLPEKSLKSASKEPSIEASIEAPIEAPKIRDVSKSLGTLKSDATKHKASDLDQRIVRIEGDNPDSSSLSVEHGKPEATAIKKLVSKVDSIAENKVENSFSFPRQMGYQLDISENGHSTDQLLKYAYQQYEVGNLDVAKESYLKVQMSDPKHRDVLLGLAAIAFSNKDYDEALRYYRERLVGAPSDPYARLGVLSLATSEVNGPALLSRVNSFVAESPHLHELHFLQGVLLSRENQWDAAQKSFFNAWSHQPQKPNYNYNLAVALDYLNRKRQALRFYRQSLEYFDSHAQFSMNKVRERIAYLSHLESKRADK